MPDHSDDRYLASCALAPNAAARGRHPSSREKSRRLMASPQAREIASHRLNECLIWAENRPRYCGMKCWRMSEMDQKRRLLCNNRPRLTSAIRGRRADKRHRIHLVSSEEAAWAASLLTSRPPQKNHASRGACASKTTRIS